MASALDAILSHVQRAAVTYVNAAASAKSAARSMLTSFRALRSDFFTATMPLLQQYGLAFSKLLSSALGEHIKTHGAQLSSRLPSENEGPDILQDLLGSKCFVVRTPHFDSALMRAVPPQQACNGTK